MLLYVTVAVLAAVVTAGASAVVLWLSRRYRLAPEIRDRDVHTKPTPRLGGVAMYLGVLCAFLFVVVFLPDTFTAVAEQPRQMFVLIAAMSIIVGIGVLDDLFDLDWMVKLGAQVLASGILAWQGMQILSLPFGDTLIVASPTLNLVLTVLIMLVVMNAVNFIDGLDGLVAGFAIIANAAFFVYTRMLAADLGDAESVTFASLIAAALVGACLGFIPFNWHRARMFMGDAGALLTGLLMATSTVTVTGQLNPASLDLNVVIAGWIPIILPVAVLALPLADLILAVARRVRAGTSPFSADRHHLHHKLIDMGHSHRQAASIFHVWTLVISVAALLTFTLESFAIPIAVVVVGSVVCLAITLVPVSRLTQLLRFRRDTTREDPQ